MRIKYQIQSFEDILHLYLFQQKYHFYPHYLLSILPHNPFLQDCIHQLFKQSSYQLLDNKDEKIQDFPDKLLSLELSNKNEISYEEIPKIQKKDIFDFSLSHSPLFINKNEYKEKNLDMIIIWEKEEKETTYRFMEKYPTDRKVFIYSHLTYDDLEILFWNRDCEYRNIPVHITKKEFLERWEEEICKVERIYSFGYHSLLYYPLLLRNDTFQVCINQEPQYLLESTFYFSYLPKTFTKWEYKEEIHTSLPQTTSEIEPIPIEEEIVNVHIPDNSTFIEEFKEDFQEVELNEPILHQPEKIIETIQEPLRIMKVLKENIIKCEREYIFDITEKNIIGLTYILCYQLDKEMKIEKIWIHKNYLMLLNESNRMLYTFFKDWYHLLHPHYIKIEFYQNGKDIINKLDIESVLNKIQIDSRYQKNFKEILKVPNYYIEYKNYVILDKNINEKIDSQKVIILKNTKEDIIYKEGDLSILLDYRKYEKYKKMIPFSYMDILHREIELIKNCKKVYYEENSNRYSYNRILFDLFSKRVV
jgi:hypothetical protein